MLPNDKQRSPVSALLVVESLDRATDYYFRTFGALESERYADPEGRVWYAVIDVLGMPIQLMEPFPDMGMGTVQTAGPSAGDYLTLTADTPDVVHAFEAAVNAGAEPMTEPVGLDWGDRAEIRDPFGHRWTLGSPLSQRDRKSAPVTVNIVARDVRATVVLLAEIFGASRPVRAGGVVPKLRTSVVRIGPGPLQITRESKEAGLVVLDADRRPRHDAAMLTVAVADVDETFARASRLGASTIIEPQVAYWGDRYAEFRLPQGLRVASCGTESLLAAVVNPADVQVAFRTFLEANDSPTSPAKIVGIQNI